MSSTTICTNAGLTTAPASAAKRQTVPSTRWDGGLRQCLGQAALGLGYFVLALPCLVLATMHGSVSPVWAPAGLALGVVLIYGRQLAVGAWLGSLAVNVYIGLPWIAALLTAAGSTFGLLLAARLFSRSYQIHGLLLHTRDVLGLAMTAAAGCLVSAAVGVLVIAWTFPVTPGELSTSFWTWWAGDLVGVLLVTPAVVIVSRWRMAPMPCQVWTLPRLLVMGSTGSLLVGLMFFCSGPLVDFLIFPYLAWIAVRLGPRWMVTATLLVAGAVSASAWLNLGPFAQQALNQPLLHLQAFLGVVALTSMFLAVVVAERRREAEALKESRARLHTILMQTNAGVVAAWPGGTMFLTNHRACEILGVGEKDLIGASATAPSWGLVDEQERPLPTGQYPINLVASGGKSLRERIVGLKTRNHRGFTWLSVNADPVFDEQGRLHYVILTFDDITHRRQAQKQLHHLATSDRLTNLPNRDEFRRRVEAAIRRKQADPAFEYAVMFLDSDRFKLINDSLGHLAGDRLLIALSRRLVGGLRYYAGEERYREALAARHGGDEFLVLLEGLKSHEAALEVAQRLQQDLAQPYLIQGHEIYTAVSIGITTSQARYQHADEVIRDADTAMYRAKHQGTPGCMLFDAQMREESQRRLALENDLRRAIERGQLYLEYQPLARLDDGRLAGFEALLRWQHPEHGRIHPEQFIPIAEETGLIRTIGAWALRQATQQMAHWQEQARIARRLQINVNIARKQLEPQAGLVPIVRQAIEESGLPPQCLHLEITENSLMDDTPELLQTLDELRAMQVQLELDDFGTGYSSLACLHRMPLSGLKIDRSFLRQMAQDSKHASILRAIIALAHELNIRATVEGVETAWQHECVRQWRADLVQGYYLSRPMPASRAVQWIYRAAEPVAA